MADGRLAEEDKKNVKKVEQKISEALEDLMEEWAGVWLKWLETRSTVDTVCCMYTESLNNPKTMKKAFEMYWKGE